VLVEVAALTDIGVSAFSLQTTRQTRIDREDLAGLHAARGEDGERAEEDEGPIPRFQRSMLSMQLCDGTHTLKAIEFRKIPQLVLGETPLGYKVSLPRARLAATLTSVQMLLKGTRFRRGIALLEPGNVVLKGHQTADREAEQDADFVRGLRARMGCAPGPAISGACAYDGIAGYRRTTRTRRAPRNLRPHLQQL
jgi:RecQ-mediated genome instability protein 1